MRGLARLAACLSRELSRELSGGRPLATCLAACLLALYLTRPLTCHITGGGADHLADDISAMRYVRLNMRDMVASTQNKPPPASSLPAHNTLPGGWSLT